jgi:hypothetical protein
MICGGGHLDDFDGVHRFGLHPLHVPFAGMRRAWLAGRIAHCTVAAMIFDVRAGAAGIPIEKKAGPAVMMHRLGFAGGRHGDFEDADEGVFKNNFVTVGRGLHGVVAIGESGFVLGVEIEVAEGRCRQDYGCGEGDGEKDWSAEFQAHFQVAHGRSIAMSVECIQLLHYFRAHS